MRNLNYSHRVFWAGVLLATAVGFGLRCYGVWENEFWTDELVAIRTSHTLESIGDFCFVRFTSPPLRYVVTWMFLNLHHEERLIRIPSLIAGTLAILVTAWVARRWFGNAAGFWAAWATALNPWMIAYSQDGRMHVVAMFFYISSIALALPFTTRMKWYWLVLGGICLALSSAVTYAAVIVCFGGLVVVFWESFRNSRQGWLADSIAFSTPWTLWMFSWLSLLWIVTSAVWAQEIPQEPIAASTTEATEAVTEVVHAPPPPRGKVPLLELNFYRESIADTWDDQPLKFLTILGTLCFFLSRAVPGAPGRGSRLLFFAIPIAIILLLQPQQFYRRYLLSLLPFSMIGIGLVGAFFSRKIWQTASFAIVLAMVSVPPTLWVLSHSPQPWKSATGFLRERVQPGDPLLVGSHQAEFAASYYMVGKIPTWDIQYHSMVREQFIAVTEERGTSWFVQWYGILPEFEQRILEYYDRVAVFPGRFGSIQIFREKEGIDKNTTGRDRDEEGVGANPD